MLKSYVISSQHVSLRKGITSCQRWLPFLGTQLQGTWPWLQDLYSYCLHVVFRHEVMVAGNTWYSFSVSTTISALCLDLLHHPWSNLIDPDIHPTAVTCIASYHCTLQRANNQLQMPCSNELYSELHVSWSEQPKLSVLMHFGTISLLHAHCIYMKNNTWLGCNILE